MSERIRYTNEPLGDLKVLPDFLPRPEDLVFWDEGVKVTIAFSKRSVDFFKGAITGTLPATVRGEVEHRVNRRKNI
jgi:hypothetical protein